MTRKTATLPEKKRTTRYDAKVRISLYASDDEGRETIAWARQRWRTWNCGEHEQPRSASTLLRDVLTHARLVDQKKKPRR